MATDTKETVVNKDAELAAPKLNDLAPTAKDAEPAEVEEPTETDNSIKDVQYVGQATRRTISAGEWTELGFEHDAVEWNLVNQFRLPAEDFSKKALHYLLRVDGSFRLVDAEEDEAEA